MTPHTRSGGAAPPSSIAYKSTPTLKQVQFPARRRRVRTYGRQNRRSGGRGDGDDDKETQQGSSAHPTPNLKQKTLTQYDFASSFKEEDVVELSDASDIDDLDKVEDTDETEAEKENNVPKGTKRRRSPGVQPAPLQPLEYLEQEKEEWEVKGKEKEEEEERVLDTEAEDEEDEEPIARGHRGVKFTDTAKTKRRRTLGEEHRRSTMKESKSSRRRTLGDSPLAGPSRSCYHTQTLTQFIGRTTSFIADSDDEELNGVVEDDGGFLEWLGTEEPQSPTMGTQASKRSTAAEPISAATQVWEDHSPSPQRRTRRRQVTQISQQQPREESVVPQTPIKSIRFDLPPSAQHISPSPTRIAAIYGAPDSFLSPSLGSQRRKQKSPVKPILELTGMPTKRVSPAKKPELVIEDSYATEGWSSVGGTQARHSMPSQAQTDVFSTPTEESAPQAAAAAPASVQVDTPTENEEEADPAPLQIQSQAGQAEERFYGAVSQIVPAASQQPLPTTPEPARQLPPPEEDVAAAVTTEEREIPDSDDDSDDFGAESDATEDEAEESRFAAGAETQLLMDQLQSSVRKWSGTPRAGNAPSSSSAAASPRLPRTSSPPPSSGTVVTPESAPPSALKPPATGKFPPKRTPPQPTLSHDIPETAHGTPLRRPLHHPEPVDTQGVPFESQRVALTTLQGFTPASARTDILLPLSHGTLANLLYGHQDAVVLPFKIPAQVVRFWILHDGVLRYLACVAATGGSSGGGRGVWSYRVAQVYELNNPAQEDDMRAEDWIHGPVRRYVYFPPAVVSQLLWNLRQALFVDASEAVTTTTPRTAAATALTSSSPLRRSSRLSTPARSRQQQQQASSPLRRPTCARRRPPPRRRRPPSTSPRRQSLVFDDHGGSSIMMPYSGVSGLDGSLAASQLLTGSQILPESLVRDEEEQERGAPEEIWDSEEEDE
ncbi:hypothetical protein BBO_01073 [Beauveria brongniartii RCEF 3172]|uniref:Uncharacterized protein n=1 Tax=Beauveria brongniartii RCEF 3172 TaxID=1081107 RepID=A0A167K2L9_9HYPO|nr:hypothetical protein BBO_01073 [Beauveria brongniartii RCEF 3172]